MYSILSYSTFDDQIWLSRYLFPYLFTNIMFEDIRVNKEAVGHPITQNSTFYNFFHFSYRV